MRKLVCILTISLAAAVFAQNERMAEVKGEVMDMLGRPIAGAEVAYSSIDTARIYRTRTDKNGKFDIVGLTPATYEVTVTGPKGEPIYSGKKGVFAGDAAALNVIHIDLSVVPTQSSLAPFKGPTAQQIQGEAWRKATESSLNDLKPDQIAELRNENAAIAHYIELRPQAEAAIKAQDWPQAQALLEQMATVAPYMWQAYANLGMIQRDRELYADAVASYEKGIQVVEYDEVLKRDRQKRNTALGQMMIGEGEAYGAWGQLEPAAVEYRKAAEIDPHPALAYMHLCVAEYNTGRAEAALTDCAAGIAADPRHPEFYQILGGIEVNLEKYEDAIVIYDKGVRLALGTLDLARSKMSSSVPQSADEFSVRGLSEALARQMLPEGGTFYRSRAGQMLLSEGNAYFALRKFKRAAELFARASKLHDYPALAYFNLCVTRFDLGEWKATGEACDRAIAADPQMADAYYVKAAALFGEAARQGKFRAPQEALSSLRKYLELDPDGSYSREVQTMLREIPSNEH